MHRYLLPLLLLATGCVTVEPAREVGIDPLDNPWYTSGRATIEDRLSQPRPGTRARNVILFIGDGMSLATVTAARIREGQLRGETGEENLLAFEQFPYTGLAKTYNTNSQVPDSAGTATAMLSGVKTSMSVIGVDEGATYDDCVSAAAHSVPTLLEHAERAGLASGVVTTTRITHATPAAAFAHISNRNWESAAPDGCADIGRQLIEFDAGDGIDVVLGGGRSYLLPESGADPERAATPGRRLDGRDLIAEWQTRYPQGRYVWNLAQFDRVGAAATRKLLGLFEPDHMQFEADRDTGPEGEPSLAGMVEKAIRILQRDGDGYFLLVEGGRIDHAHHVANAYRALHDTVAFSDAVRRARELTGTGDTLIVVTADHGHVMEIAGYPRRGNPILGKVVDFRAANDTDYAPDAAGRPYTTLVYGNGPGHIEASAEQPAGPKRFPHAYADHSPEPTLRPDLTDIDTTAPDYLQEAAVPMSYETHSGTDVPVYADGPGAWLLTGVYEQSYIFHVMLHALFGD